MRTIEQINALVNAGKITEEEAISYVIDFYGNEEDNMDKITVHEDYCAVDTSGRSQNVNYGDYTCSGEIVDFSWWHRNFYKEAKENESGELECKIYHTNIYTFVGGELVIMRLYDVLTEYDINK